MVTLLNDGLSDGNPNKRSLENGYHCSNLANPPKYKSRKVSAVRDFPPMCGRNAHPMKSDPKENGVLPVGDNAVVAGESNVFKTEKAIQNQLSEGVKSPVKVDAHGIRTLNDGFQTETMVQTQVLEGMKSHTEMEIDEFGSQIDFGDRENVAFPRSDNAVKALETNVVRIETEVETQPDETVGSPYGVEENKSLDKLVEKVVVGFTGVMDDGIKQMVLDAKPMGIELVKDPERKATALELSKEVNGRDTEALAKELDKEETAVSVKSMGVDEVKPSVEIGYSGGVPIKDIAVPSPKSKFRRRRVSAIRDFPPYCGRNAPVPSMQENPKLTSGESSLEVNKVNVENGIMEATKDLSDSKSLKDGADRRSSKEILPVKAEKHSLAKSKNSGKVSALVESGTPRDEPAKGDIQTADFQGSQVRGVVPLPKNLSDAFFSKDDEEGQVSVSKELVLFGDDTTCDRGMVSLPKNLSDAVINKDTEADQGSASKVRVMFEDDDTGDTEALDNTFGLRHEDDRVIVTGLMAAPYCPWRQGKAALSSGGGISKGNANNNKSTWRGKSKAVAKKTVKLESSGRSFLNKSAVSVRKDADGTLGTVVRGEVKSSSQDEEPHNGSTAGSMVDVNLPPFGPSLVNGDARNRVRETLRLFQALCRKLLQGEESRSGEDTMLKQSEKIKRIDLQAAKIIKEKGKEVNTGKQYLGAVPGVEVGDEFQYRVELAIVGIHRLYQAGIDSMKHNGVPVATSIVASGAYDDDMENPDVLIYSGQGGNIVGKDKQPEDQKLEKGNLALWNSISKKTPVRVIRGFKETKVSDSLDSRGKVVTSYIYDGLYTVEKCREETGTHGKLVFMFELKRIPGQPELAWKEVKKSKKSRVRHGVCHDDIAGGLESLPICAINTIDNEKPQQFNYIKKMIYPDWLCLVPPKGCDCIGRCSDSRKCSCAQRNGGEIPYNRNGAIVEAKPLVYECGPHCKCPPSCYNKVTQHGIKIQLEIFKTESRGWGVRSLYSIPSGSFICEYVGELLEDKEAELRAGSDEYLFDIGKSYGDCSLKPDEQGNSSEAAEEGGYTIDAAKCGNIGRFINHSCSPNLYAQDVLYDHDDKRMPHVMLFAAENIPPLKELTYHYNYIVGQVHDSNGNVKMKNCYCGSTECTGRMY
ncbi:hypothetical protein ACH5RR_038818 [Cinchona calisaya]|uniref:Uncharacterized protein n=1 Tax=Cinchona calisaya TaxID=153742 RepID=A0ABD2Y0I1_9GENT